MQDSDERSERSDTLSSCTHVKYSTYRNTVNSTCSQDTDRSVMDQCPLYGFLPSPELKNFQALVYVYCKPGMGSWPCVVFWMYTCILSTLLGLLLRHVFLTHNTIRHEVATGNGRQGGMIGYNKQSQAIMVDCLNKSGQTVYSETWVPQWQQLFKGQLCYTRLVILINDIDWLKPYAYTTSINKQ